MRCQEVEKKTKLALYLMLFNSSLCSNTVIADSEIDKNKVENKEKQHLDNQAPQATENLPFYKAVIFKITLKALFCACATFCVFILISGMPKSWVSPIIVSTFFPFIKSFAVYYFYEYKIEGLSKWISVPSTYIFLLVVTSLIEYHTKFFGEEAKKEPGTVVAIEFVSLVMLILCSLFIYVTIKIVNYFKEEVQKENESDLKWNDQVVSLDTV